MKKRDFILLSLFISAYFTPGFSQKKATYHWEEESCTCTGKFDTRLYSLAQLQNTEKYLVYPGELPVPIPFYLREMQEMRETDMHRLDSICTRTLDDLQNLPFISAPYWDRMKEMYTKQLLAECKLKKITLAAYVNPDTLRAAGYVPATCAPYWEALMAGGKKMMDEWEKLVRSFFRYQKDTTAYYQEYLDKRNSRDSTEYARVFLTRYGWWPCASQSIPWVDWNESPYIEFRKVFKKIKCTCNEE